MRKVLVALTIVLLGISTAYAKNDKTDNGNHYGQIKDKHFVLTKVYYSDMTTINNQIQTLNNQDITIENNINNLRQDTENSFSNVNMQLVNQGEQINNNSVRIDDVERRVNDLEKSQFILGGEIRVYDSKFFTVKPYLDYSTTRHEISETGVRVTLKVGKSYEEERIEELERKLKDK